MTRLRPERRVGILLGVVVTTARAVEAAVETEARVSSPVARLILSRPERRAEIPRIAYSAEMLNSVTPPMLRSTPVSPNRRLVLRFSNPHTTHSGLDRENMYI